MNASRPVSRSMVMIATLSACLLVSAAEPPAASQAPAAAATGKPESKPVPAPGAAKPATVAPATPATPAAAAKTEEPERFEATEKVRADFEVSFPVDI